MHALTKERRTEAVEIKFIGPVANLNRALEAMKSLGFMDASDHVPWHDAFPKFARNEHGTILRGARLKEELTQVQLAEKIGVRPHHISEMELRACPPAPATISQTATFLN